MELPLGHDEFEGQQEDERCNVEGWGVGEDGVALNALERHDGTAELNLRLFVGDDARERVGQHGDEDGREEGVAQEGEADHERRAQDDVEARRLIDTRSVETEPNPQEPLAYRHPAGGVRVAHLLRLQQPLEGEQEAGEAPDADEGEDCEVPHHGVQRDEDDIVREEVEGDAGEDNGRGNGEDGKAVSIGDAAGDEIEDSGEEIGGVDGDEAYVEEGPQALGMKLPAVFNDCGKLLQHPAGRVDAESQLPQTPHLVFVMHRHEVEEEEDDELEQLDEASDARHLESVVVQQVGFSRVVHGDGQMFVVVG